MSTTIAATMTVLDRHVRPRADRSALGTWVLSWSRPRQEASCSSRSTSARLDSDAATQINRGRREVRPRSTRSSRRSTFVSKAEALRADEEANPELVKGGLAVQPAAGRATRSRRSRVRTSSQISAAAAGRTPPGVDEGEQRRQDARSACCGSAHVIEIVFLVGVILLVIASTMLIANTIRLSIFSRRREIEVMKLVGATNWFVRGPFMVEGLLCGLGGALARGDPAVLGKAVVAAADPRHRALERTRTRCRSR